MKAWLERRAFRRRVRRHQDFVGRLSSLRIEADKLGLPHVHNHIARALRDAPFEIRSKNWGH